MLDLNTFIIIFIQVVLTVILLNIDLLKSLNFGLELKLSKKKISIPELWLSKFTSEEIIEKELQQAANPPQNSLLNAFSSSQNLEFNILTSNADAKNPIHPIVKDINKILIASRNDISLEQIRMICQQHIDIQPPKYRLVAALPLILGLLLIPVLQWYSLFNADAEIQNFINEISHLIIYDSFVDLLVVTSLGLFSYLWILNTTHQKIQKVKSSIYAIEMFCQTELKSNETNNLGTVLLVVQNSLQAFNEQFSKNMLLFKDAAVAIQENSSLQKDFVQKINELSTNDIANFNLQIIERFETALGQFDQFNQWFGKLHENTQNAQSLSDKINTLFQSTNQIGTDIGTVAQKIDRRLDEAHLLLQFLKHHFSEIEDRKHLISNSIINFDDFLQKALQELQIHTEERVNAIKDITLRDEDLMIKAFDKNRDAFSHLSHLELLQTIYQQLTSLLERYSKESDYMNQGMRSVLTKLDASNQNLELIRIEEQKRTK
jgi:methyl-accepting chemotaxis protein